MAGVVNPRLFVVFRLGLFSSICAPLLFVLTNEYLLEHIALLHIKPAVIVVLIVNLDRLLCFLPGAKPVSKPSRVLYGNICSSLIAWTSFTDLLKMLFILRYLILFATFVAAKGCNLADNSTCPSGAHIVVTRGSLEPQGSGLMGAVAQQIMLRIPNSDTSPLKYPAIFEPYVPSQTEGVRTLAKVVRDYAALCPKTKMILLGYSQVS